MMKEATRALGRSVDDAGGGGRHHRCHGRQAQRPGLQRRHGGCCPEGFMLIEHLPDEQIPAAKQQLDRVMERVGLTWQV